MRLKRSSRFLLFMIIIIVVTINEVNSSCGETRYGKTSKSCKKIKDEKFQIRGVRIVPMWEFMLLNQHNSSSNSNYRIKRDAGYNSSSLPPLRVTASPARITEQIYNSNGHLEPIPHIPMLMQPVDSFSKSLHSRSDIGRARFLKFQQPLSEFLKYSVDGVHHSVDRRLSQRAGSFVGGWNHDTRHFPLPSHISQANHNYHQHENGRKLKRAYENGYPTNVSPAPVQPVRSPAYPTPTQIGGQYQPTPNTAGGQYQQPSVGGGLQYQQPPVGAGGGFEQPVPVPVASVQRPSVQPVQAPAATNNNDNKSALKQKKKKKTKSKKNKRKCAKCKNVSEESSEEEKKACEICMKSKSKKTEKPSEIDGENKNPEDVLKSAIKVRPIPTKSSEEDQEEEKAADDLDEEGKEGKEENGNDEDQGEKKDEDEEEEGGEEKEEDEEEEKEDDSSNEEDDDNSLSKEPKIDDYASRARHNTPMKIPIIRGKPIVATKPKTVKAKTDDGSSDEEKEEEEEDNGQSEYKMNIRDQETPTKYSDKPNVKYSYPPKDTLPLQTCFHNPSGYVCCNLELNNLVETTYKEIRESSDYNPCNLQKIANKVQRVSEKMFSHPFETVISHADFAQNINFAGDLVCKLEVDGKYMIAYGTPYNAESAVGPQGADGKPLPVRSLRL